MKTFAYYIGIFIIVAVMFACPILATFSFCLDWDFSFKWLLTAITVVDFAIVMFAIWWFVEDFDDD